MKPQIILGLLFPIFAMGCALHEKPPAIEFTAVVDLTEDSIATVQELNVGNIKGITRSEQNLKQGITVTLKSISDTRYGQSYTSVLPSVSELNMNDLERKKEQTQFWDKVESDIQTIKNQTHDRKQSYVIHGIVSALNSLTNNKDKGVQILAILSDLAENTPTFSVFNRRDFSLLKKEPEKFKKYIDASYQPSGSIHNVQIYFVHRPGANDEVYHLMATILKEYFLEKGAKSVQTVGSMDEITID